MTTGEQIETWKKELVRAMTSRQWRRALQFCSWLRYTLWQQDLSDPEVEEVHCRPPPSFAGHPDVSAVLEALRGGGWVNDRARSITRDVGEQTGISVRRCWRPR